MKEIKTTISIKIKLKDGKTLNLDFEDGKKLFAELSKVYDKEVIKKFIPCYPIFPNYPCEDHSQWWLSETTRGNAVDHTVVLGNSSIQ